MAFQARQVAIERVFKLLDEEWEDNTGLSPLLVSKGQIEIKNLSFSYEKDFNILKNIDFPKVELIDIDTFVALLSND